jgi:hypothetical protein
MTGQRSKVICIAVHAVHGQKVRAEKPGTL